MIAFHHPSLQALNVIHFLPIVRWFLFNYLATIEYRCLLCCEVFFFSLIGSHIYCESAQFSCSSRQVCLKPDVYCNSSVLLFEYFIWPSLDARLLLVSSFRESGYQNHISELSDCHWYESGSLMQLAIRVRSSIFCIQSLVCVLLWH